MASDRCHKIDWKLPSGARHAFDGRNALREHLFLLKVILGGLLPLACMSLLRLHALTAQRVLIPNVELAVRYHRIEQAGLFGMSRAVRSLPLRPIKLCA